MGLIYTVGPNEALIVSGGCCNANKRVVVVGGWAYAWCCITNVQRLSLTVMTLHPMCEDVETVQGVALTITGVAQCKVMSKKEILLIAAEQLMGKSRFEIETTVLSTMEGHLRAILGTLSVEEVYRDRDQFAALVREVAAPDVGRMGIEILSFTIRDVYDNVNYLSSLGKAQIASVKRDADIGVAQSNRDAGIREAECEKAAMDVKYTTDTNIENNYRRLQLNIAQFDQQVNTAKAEAQLAYELQAARVKQDIRIEEVQIDVIERRKEIEIEAREVQRKERELASTIRLDAEAESYRVKTISEGAKIQKILTGRAESERIIFIGEAEAAAIAAVGKAEADRMKLKANVFKQYGDAAVMSIVLDALPKIAAEVSAPLAKTEDIVLIGGANKATYEISKLMGQLPPVVNALAGVDVSKVLSKLPGATTAMSQANTKVSNSVTSDSYVTN